MSIQAQIRATLERSGIPHKRIECYGRQIMITSWSLEAANKWAALIQQFAKLRGVVHSRETNTEQTGRRLHESHEVWLTAGMIE